MSTRAGPTACFRLAVMPRGQTGSCAKLSTSPRRWGKGGPALTLDASQLLANEQAGTLHLYHLLFMSPGKSHEAAGGPAKVCNMLLRHPHLQELEDARLKSERQSQLLAAAEAARCAAEEDRGRIEPRFARPDQAAWLLLVTRLKVDLDVTRGRQAACEARLREQARAGPVLYEHMRAADVCSCKVPMHETQGQHARLLGAVRGSPSQQHNWVLKLHAWKALCRGCWTRALLSCRMALSILRWIFAGRSGVAAAGLH